jgi:hypothetical protein
MSKAKCGPNKRIGWVWGSSFVENHGDEPAGRTSRSTLGKRMAACYLLGVANLWRM